MTSVLRPLTLLIFFIGSSLAHGQNLVPNSSFEKTIKPKPRWSGTGDMFNRSIRDWTSPTQGSPDLLVLEHLGIMFPPRPKVDMTPYQPHSGNTMVGIKSFGCKTKTLHCKEYLQVKLKQSIIKGCEYEYSYYLLPLQNSPFVGGFGIALSEDVIIADYASVILDIEAVDVDEDLVVNKDNTWIQVTGTFLADKDASHIIIGNFTSDELIKSQVEQAEIEYGYYLIDDVYLSGECAKPEVFTLENLMFDFDKAELKAEGIEKLDELLSEIQSDQKVNLFISGHTDNLGSETYNLNLSQDRADEVKLYFLNKGLSEERLHTEGRGSTEPIVSNDSEENRQKNRRVEILIK